MGLHPVYYGGAIMSIYKIKSKNFKKGLDGSFLFYILISDIWNIIYNCFLLYYFIKLYIIS